jgi:hypothetical protein
VGTPTPMAARTVGGREREADSSRSGLKPSCAYVLA